MSHFVHALFYMSRYALMRINFSFSIVFDFRLIYSGTTRYRISSKVDDSDVRPRPYLGLACVRVR